MGLKPPVGFGMGVECECLKPIGLGGCDVGAKSSVSNRRLFRELVLAFVVVHGSSFPKELVELLGLPSGKGYGTLS